VGENAIWMCGGGNKGGFFVYLVGGSSNMKVTAGTVGNVEL
jgi:hypothetical protein